MSMRYQAGFLTASYFPLKVPNAPTIGTATATGVSGTVSVTFTAPSDVGGGSITSYSVVSTPGAVIGTGASSPVTVSGLTNGTAYTFKVLAINAYGPSALSAASNSVTPVEIPTVIGQVYGGGYYAGQIGVSGVATHYLVVGPKATAESQKQWKTSNTTTAGTSSVIDGPANSTAMNDASHPAAQFCEGLTIGGFSDWYMPAKNELEVCYYNLKPSTSNNSTGSGINANAVPARASNYTTGTPAQTSATNFRYTGSEYYQGDMYWASTEQSATQGWSQNFDYGAQAGFPKNGSLYWVRAIRRVAV